MAHAHNTGFTNAGFNNANLTFRDRQKLRDLQLQQQFRNQNRQPPQRNFQANTIGGGIANLGTALGDLRRQSQSGQQGLGNLISPNIPEVNRAFNSFISSGNTAAPSSVGSAIGTQGRAPTGPANINALVSQASNQFGIPENVLNTIFSIESKFNPNAKNPNSSASGIGQFINKTAERFDIDPFDPAQAIPATAKLAVEAKEVLEPILGRPLTAGEFYLAHQQGVQGAVNLLSNPDAKAVDIVGKKQVTLNGGNENTTASEFAAKWVNEGNRVAGQQPQAAAGARPQAQPQPQAGIAALINPAGQQAQAPVGPGSFDLTDTPAFEKGGFEGLLPQGGLPQVGQQQQQQQRPQVQPQPAGLNLRPPAPQAAQPAPGLPPGVSPSRIQSIPPGVQPRPPAPPQALQPQRPIQAPSAPQQAPIAPPQPQAAPRPQGLPPIQQIEAGLEQEANRLQAGIAQFGTQANPALVKQATDRLTAIRKRLSPDGRLKALKDRQALQFGQAREGRSQASELRDQAVEQRAQTNQVAKEAQTEREEAKFSQDTAAANRKLNAPITERDSSGRLFNVETGENVREVGEKGFFLVDDELAFNEKWIARQENKNFVAAGNAVATMKSNLINKSPAADSATVIAFAKLLDPTSVVRESEAGRIEAIGPISQKVSTLIEKFNSGEMTDRVRDDIVRTSINIYKSMQTQYNARRAIQVKKAEALDFRPEIAVDDNNFVGEFPDLSNKNYDPLGNRIQPVQQQGFGRRARSDSLAAPAIRQNLGGNQPAIAQPIPAAPAQPAPQATPTPAPQPAPQPAPAQPGTRQPVPQPGETRQGDNGELFMFLGGDPKDPNNWFTEGATR